MSEVNTIAINNKPEQEKCIRYMLPVELQVRAFPGNILLARQQGLRVPYSITEKEKEEITDRAKKERTSFDEELKKHLENSFESSEYVYLTLATLRTQYREYDTYTYHFELTGAVRLAKEGEKGYFPKIEKKLKPWHTKLRLRHIMIITSILAILAVLAVVIFNY